MSEMETVCAGRLSHRLSSYLDLQRHRPSSSSRRGDAHAGRARLPDQHGWTDDLHDAVSPPTHVPVPKRHTEPTTTKANIEYSSKHELLHYSRM